MLQVVYEIEGGRHCVRVQVQRRRECAKPVVEAERHLSASEARDVAAALLAAAAEAEYAALFDGRASRRPLPGSGGEKCAVCEACEAPTEACDCRVEEPTPPTAGSHDCEHGFIGACAECDGGGQTPEEA